MILKSKAKWWLLSLILINVIIVFINPGVADSSAAHLVGIIVGLIFGIWLRKNHGEADLSCQP